MSREITHELKVYANREHRLAQPGELILHLWFTGRATLDLDIDIARHRSDVAYVELIDCVKHTTERLYPFNKDGGIDDSAAAMKKRKPARR